MVAAQSLHVSVNDSFPDAIKATTESQAGGEPSIEAASQGEANRQEHLKEILLNPPLG